MGKRVNIGIFIGAEDKDIAAWFNLLTRNKLSHAKWIRALLASYALEKKLAIGTIDQDAANQLNHPDIGKQGDSSRKLRYGWAVRGPNKEFVVGSTINIGLTKDEIFPVLDEIWANGHKRATFIKALIRENLQYADQDIPPKAEDRQAIWAKYLVFANSKPLDRSDSSSKPQSDASERVEPAVDNPQPIQRENPCQKPIEQPGHEATVGSDFQSLPPQPSSSGAETTNTSPKTWNPLLDQI
ncbi:MAG: hypothetical protein HFF17_13510 [Oscillospiraceae bacterium]|nr:hypothetical protein [Oscillospiraceae bacterium]